MLNKNLGLFYFDLFDRSVDSFKFIKFLKALRKKHGQGDIVLYMDSLPVHKSKYVRPHFEELNIRPLYAPIYSPEYNPIEMMFSKLKRRVKNMRLRDMVQAKKREFA